MDSLPESAVRVSLLEIDWEDRAFEIRRFASSSGLDKSLARCGLLAPPWLLRGNGGRFTIVDGFKRLEWLRESGVEAAFCVAMPRGLPLASLWLWRLTLKAFGPPLNVAEKAQIAQRILDWLPDDEDRRQLLASLGIPSRTDILGRWRDLASGSVGLLRAAALGDISERAALELASWGEDEAEARDAIVEHLRQLKCSASIQMEIVERVSELAQARDTSRLTVIRMPEIHSVAAHPNWNHREKTQALRELLRRLRHARLCARERSFQEHLAALSLPRAIRISPPPSFEGGVYRLEIDFSTPEALTAHGDTLRALASDPRLEILLHPGRPEDD